MLPFQPNHSVMDGITVLQTVVSSDEPIGSREVARRLGMDTTRANRLLKTLAAMGMLAQTPSRKYGPGHGIHVLSAQSLRASGLLNAALAPLESLRRFGLIVSMGVVWHGRVSYLYHKQGLPRDAAPAAQRGEAPDSPAVSGLDGAIAGAGAFPVESSGLGIALLAALPDDRIRDENPGLSERAWHEIREARTRRYAYVPNGASHTLALPVGPTREDPQAAIGFAGIIPEPDISRLLPALQEAANQINERLLSFKNTRNA